MRKSEHVSCGCGQCRRGRHSKSGRAILKRVARKLRRTYRQLLKRGEEPIVTAATPYTD